MRYDFMEKDKAVPRWCLLAGQVAKRMNITVHCHREGLLSPSVISDGGRRLHRKRYVLKLHQILPLKHWGFSKRLAAHNHRANSFPIRPLGWFSPLEFSIQYVWQTDSPLLHSNSELLAKMRF